MKNAITHNSPMNIHGYPFRFVQRLIPKLKDGKISKDFPQKRYNNVKNLPLHSYGEGAFCRFVVKDAPAVAGVYMWIVADEIIYIGETKNLADRFNNGYGNISPRNCFVGGQRTNCKMNKVVMECYEKGTPVDLYFFETTDHKQVEIELLGCENTKYNTKNNR